MTGTLVRTTPRDLLAEIPDFPEALHGHAQLSDPLLLGHYAGAPFCVVGAIPPTVIADTATLWGWNTGAVANHPVAYALWARRLLPELLRRYPTLTGYCHFAKRRWLASLGAELTPADWPLYAFTIRSAR